MHLIAVPLLLVLIACAAHAADSKITIEDLTQRAADWYLRLAKTGDARAQTSLGLMYARGYGVPKNIAEAHRWWNFAAIQNDPGAQYNLGLTYVRGEGVAVDYERAARWFREASRRGHVQAQHNLGMLYHEGKGVPKDARQAYYWIRVAALQGDTIATDTPPKISDGMTVAQIAEAEAQAAAWMRQSRKVLQ